MSMHSSHYDVPFRWMLAAILLLMLTSSSSSLVIPAHRRKHHHESPLDSKYDPTTVATQRSSPLFATAKKKTNKNSNNGSNAINNNDDEKTLVYELDGGGSSSFTVLGSRSAKRRLLNATHRLAKDLAALAQQYKDIERRIAVLKKPGRISEEDELKRLKRQKLAVADISRALRSMSRRQDDDATKIVGAGGFCDVLIGHQVISKSSDANHRRHHHLVELQKGEPVAVKISHASSDAILLLAEARKIQSLQSYPGFVRVRHVQPQWDDEGNAAVVLDLLGPSLEDLWWGCTCGAGGFSCGTTLRLAEQLVRRLETLAAEGMAHRDLQPANILVGRVGDGARRTLHVIDFGIAATVGHNNASLIAPPPRADDFEPRHIFSGTPRFASVSALRGHGGGATAADDLESVCYTLAFLFKGDVPWSDEAEANAGTTREGALRLADLKAAANPLCDGTEPADGVINRLLDHARECQRRGVAPDYANFCRGVVRDALVEEGRARGGRSLSKFDWEEQNLGWSDETGELHHSLYSDVDGDW